MFSGSKQEVQVLVAASHLAVERKDFDTAIRMLGKYVCYVRVILSYLFKSFLSLSLQSFAVFSFLFPYSLSSSSTIFSLLYLEIFTLRFIFNSFITSCFFLFFLLSSYSSQIKLHQTVQRTRKHKL